MVNGDAGFSAVSGVFRYLNHSAYFQNDVHYQSGTPGNTGNVVEWKFTDLAPGAYRVLATWVSHSNRATDAPRSTGCPGT